MVEYLLESYELIFIGLILFVLIFYHVQIKQKHWLKTFILLLVIALFVCVTSIMKGYCLYAHEHEINISNFHYCNTPVFYDEDMLGTLIFLFVLALALIQEFSLWFNK